jgi:2-succinyl-5-enolpyruvyl-6-hydroxy-3-cyclohexene-1-carboxylate synthase
VAYADSLLRSSDVLGKLEVEAVVRLGSPWASRVLAETLGVLGEGAPQVLVDPWAGWKDPQRVASHLVMEDPTSWCAEMASRVERSAPDGWRRSWDAADEAADDAIAAWLDDHEELTEPGVARVVAASVPMGATLFLSSSMPVRDVEWFAPKRAGWPAVLANRGANGIDGVVSTALGVAHGRGSPVVALLGDVAFLHDLTALTRLGGLREVRDVKCTVVVVDNGGGGIFSFLPQAETLAEGVFEPLFGTPHRMDLCRIAGAFGLESTSVGTRKDLEDELARPPEEGVKVVHVSVPDRSENVRLHEELYTAVTLAAGKALSA